MVENSFCLLKSSFGKGKEKGGSFGGEGQTKNSKFKINLESRSSKRKIQNQNDIVALH